MCGRRWWNDSGRRTFFSFDRELDLVDELGIDSMDLTTVVLVLQDEYDITIDEDDYPKLRNIHQIARYVQDLLAR